MPMREESESVSKEEFENFKKQFDEFQKRATTMLSNVAKEGGESSGVVEKASFRATATYCPTCHTATDDLFAHLMSDPEKHGLVKKVEVVKEVLKKRSMQQILIEHDIFECPECREIIDEFLDKKGLEITEKKKGGFWPTIEL